MDERKEELKRLAAERALDFITDGHIVGLGTGSTAAYAIKGLASRISVGLKVTAVATSLQSADMARELGIQVIDFNDVSAVDVTIDGADQIDHALDMIKGGGGALTREKLVALASRLEVIAVDDSKLVPALGEGFPVPVEVVPFGWRLAAARLAQLGCTTRLREKGGRPFVTDNGNWVVDTYFGPISDAAHLEKNIKLIPGIVENGLFVGLADIMVVAGDGGVRVLERTVKKRLSRLDEI